MRAPYQRPRLSLRKNNDREEPAAGSRPADSERAGVHIVTNITNEVGRDGEGHLAFRVPWSTCYAAGVALVLLIFNFLWVVWWMRNGARGDQSQDWSPEETLQQPFAESEEEAGDDQSWVRWGKHIQVLLNLIYAGKVFFTNVSLK